MSTIGSRRLAAYGAGLGSIALLTLLLVPVRAHLELTSTGFLFLAAVTVVAARWGWGPGVVTLVAANLGFNYFFVPPRHQFNVQDPSNAVALGVFLLVAALTSALLARARAGEAAARRQAGEVSLLYELVRLLMSGAALEATLRAVCERVCQTFGAHSCSVWLLRAGTLRRAAHTGTPEPETLSQDERQGAEEALRGGAPVMLGGGPGRRTPRIVGRTGRPLPVAFVPARAGGQPAGLLRVTGRLRARIFTRDELRLLEVFAGELALAVERDRLQHEAARAEALAETDRLKSALLSAVSHDLRTPLASIKASVSSLLTEEVAWDHAAQREFLSAIDEETDRLTRLVSNLLDLSRIEGGALRPDIDRYDVRELLETVTARLSRSITAHPLALETASDTGEAALDYVQISQVVANLVENAAKFAPEGTVITIAARRAGDAVEITVSDAGPGIPPEERQRVFEKFYRTPGAAGRPGAGLGLAISKGLVEAHGGTITIEQADGGGTRVRVRLPLAPAVPGPPGYERPLRRQETA